MAACCPCTGASTARRCLARWLVPIVFCILANPIALADGGGTNPPKGVLQSPRLQVFSSQSLVIDREQGTASNLARSFTFKGWVDFPPSAGELWIVVGCDGDSFPGNGTRRVKVFQPSKTISLIGGRTVWRFSSGPFQPFLEAVTQAEASGEWCGKPWQDGGTARVSVIAHRFRDGQTSELVYRDQDGVRIQAHDLIFADADRTPDTQRFYIPSLYPVPQFLGKKDQTGTAKETKTYYQSVFVDVLGQNPKQTIWNSLPTLRHFRERFFRTDGFFFGDTVSGSAVFFNKGDLGIGREMHCHHNFRSQETACFVKNFSHPDGSLQLTFNPSFDKDVSKRAIDAKRPFATVAMVSRGGMADNRPNKVFFAVYQHQGRYKAGVDPIKVQDDSPLALEAQLDKRAHNKFVPGNCLVCHGAQATYLKNTKQVFFAKFLPFDVQHALDFYSDDPSDALSRSKQEPRVRELNWIISHTDLYGHPEARELMNGFYGAPADFVVHPNLIDWPLRRFNDDFLPDGWKVHRDARQIYRKVVAPYCRTCHISHTSLHFGSWENFVTFQHQIRHAICNERDRDIMPNAEATLNAFWRSDARAQLVSRFNGPGCGLEPFE